MILTVKHLREIEVKVKAKVLAMQQKPRIVSVLVGNDPASVLYTKLKKSAAQRCGIDFEVVRLNTLTNEIAKIGAREDVSGVMVQLPIPGLPRGRTPRILEAIPLDKDVDGLRWEESKIMPATVRAVFAILDKIAESQIINSQILKLRKYIVVGARGVVGRPLVYFLRERGAEVTEVEWDTPRPFDLVAQGEVVISCVGKVGVVTGEMVREGVIAIDVGSPTGDMKKEVYDKASVAVAVPGGVGPVTIASLMANAVDLVI